MATGGEISRRRRGDPMAAYVDARGHGGQREVLDLLWILPDGKDGRPSLADIRMMVPGRPQA